MKTLPAGLQTMLASGVTTLCRCWKLTRTDGVVLGFTDHDRDLPFDGVTYEAAAGMSAAELAQSIDLSVDTIEIAGGLRSDHLNEPDLAMGLFDNAALVLFVVDWGNVANRVILFAGSIGEVSRGRVGFTAEMRGLSAALNQPTGRIYSRACDADLGDTRCGIDLTSPTYKGNGAVTAVTDNRTFSASGLGAYADSWFQRGKLTWTSGANAGFAIEVRAHNNIGGVVAFQLWEIMPNDIAVGDTFDVTAGCDKSFETCKSKFSNVVNFRGFPQIPGTDALTSVVSSANNNDGGSRNGV